LYETKRAKKLGKNEENVFFLKNWHWGTSGLVTKILMLAQLMGETCKCRDSCQFQGQGFCFVFFPFTKQTETPDAGQVTSTGRRQVAVDDF